MIAALYVQTGGVYFGLPEVDPWDAKRDARLYAGPWPVVAHPPCARWTPMFSAINEKRYGLKQGEDGGCFAAALEAVRRWGGVLEHPAQTLAWRFHFLPVPVRGRWMRSLLCGGWVTEVSQVAYGHPARKRTWLYYHGIELPPELDWREPPAIAIVGRTLAGRSIHKSLLPGLWGHAAAKTPEPFRDLLLGMAASARREAVA